MLDIHRVRCRNVWRLGANVGYDGALMCEVAGGPDRHLVLEWGGRERLMDHQG